MISVDTALWVVAVGCSAILVTLAAIGFVLAVYGAADANRHARWCEKMMEKLDVFPERGQR